MSPYLTLPHFMSSNRISSHQSHLISSHYIYSSFLDISPRPCDSIYLLFFDYDLFCSLSPTFKELVERILEAQDLARTQVTRQPSLLLLVLVLLLLPPRVLLHLLLPLTFSLLPALLLVLYLSFLI